MGAASGALRVVFVAEDVSAIAGGLPAVVRQLSGRLVSRGVRVQVLYAKGDRADLPNGVEIHYFPPGKLGQVWSWGVGLRGRTRRLANQMDGMCPVFHLHGVWSAPQYFAAISARAYGVPFIVSPHGMLEPWLWDEQGWKVRMKKRFYWAVAGYPALSKATVIHAITPLEQQHLSRIFPGNRIEIIPNAIDIPEFGLGLASERENKILYLGRIEPKKGADILLRAFAAAIAPFCPAGPLPITTRSYSGSIKDSTPFRHG